MGVEVVNVPQIYTHSEIDFNVTSPQLYNAIKMNLNVEIM